MNFKKLMEPYCGAMEMALAKVVSFKSVFDEKTIGPNAPFGEGVSKALNYMAFLGENYGFNVDKCEGYCTEVSFGNGSNTIGIFGHMDVVPVNEKKWASDPFKMILKDGNYYGRGVSDDKGPCIASFYAVKMLKDNGLIPSNSTIKLVFGGDEEKGSKCIRYYFENLKKLAPKYSFTPDATFPLIYGEKGITHFVLTGEKLFKNILSIKGGIAGNVVIDSCDFELVNSSEVIEKLKINNVPFEIKENKIYLTFKGHSAHASMPELGDNAFIKGCKVLGKILDEKILIGFAESFADNKGKSFGGYLMSPELKETTYSVGIISYENEKLNCVVDFRYGENVKEPTELMNKLATKIGVDLNPNFDLGKPLLVSKNSMLVKTLMSAYKDELKVEDEPFTIGGGTYAKHIPNCVAFGPQFKGTETKIHEEDELLPKEELLKMAAIYARAIFYLTKLK